MNTYREFIDDVVRDVADLTATAENRKHAVEHIESFLKLYEQTVKANCAAGNELGDAGQWLLPARLLSDEPMFWRRDRFREPTESESLDVYYTLLAIIHDGQNQGNAPNRRIYFDWKDTDTDSLDVKCDIDKMLRDLPTQGNAPKPESYFMGGKLCELPELANNIAYLVWSFYSARPRAASWWGPLYHNSESKRRSQIQDALNVVRIDLRPLANANEQEKEIEDDLAKLKPEEKEQKAAPEISIQNSNVILGDIHQPENLQVGDNTRIYKQEKTGQKKKGSIKKLLKIIGTVVGFLAALLTILHLLGWLEPIKDFVVKMIWSK